jgi:hypothetical protein
VETYRPVPSIIDIPSPYAPLDLLQKVLDRLLARPRPEDVSWTDSVARLRRYLEERKARPERGDPDYKAPPTRAQPKA